MRIRSQTFKFNELLKCIEKTCCRERRSDRIDANPVRNCLRSAGRWCSTSAGFTPESCRSNARSAPSGSLLSTGSFNWLFLWESFDKCLETQWIRIANTKGPKNKRLDPADINQHCSLISPVAESLLDNRSNSSLHQRPGTAGEDLTIVETARDGWSV